jgi:hypothetical protein
MGSSNGLGKLHLCSIAFKLKKNTASESDDIDTKTLVKKFLVCNKRKIHLQQEYGLNGVVL